MPRTGLRAAIDRGEPHVPHQRAHVIAADRRAFPTQQIAEHATAGKGDAALAQGESTGVTSNPWKHRDPGAVAQFLFGESAFRRLHTKGALDHCRKSIALDSTFALAALRGAQAASLNHRGSEASSMIGVALADPLPPRCHDDHGGDQSPSASIRTSGTCPRGCFLTWGDEPD